ncbi:protein FAR1-RELATED SEQUENCE 1-like, partial [Primulina huaijiensis]|uniref:protein FAR1-RELATED SEQUENCE 1-like n=1 Tax=Primulina huaijiensis TaxID=1492673 RepID=UPI003CC6E720
MENDKSKALEELEEGYGEESKIDHIPETQCGLPNFSMQENGEVQTENFIVDVLKSKLEVGKIVNSLEEAYLLYCQYAHAKGFSVRKGEQRCFSHTDELQSKEFNCSCEGLKDEKRSSKKIPFYQKLLTRTNCKAKLKISRENGGQWSVSRFVEEHNHEIFEHGQTHLLRSVRNISHAKKSTLEAMATWKYMIDTYKLDDHRWLNGMYRLREKWATAFSSGRFSAGLLATSRSEATNMTLKKACNKMSSLYEFVMSYAKIQNNWRNKEKTEDTRCRHGKPAQILKNHPLLINAAEVYTISIYQLFEIELVNSLNCKFVEPPSCFGNDWNWIEVKVKSHDENSRVRHVVFNKQSHEIKCSCHKFETMGILCKHALMMFNYMDVTVLPNSYILKRWMKNVRNSVKYDFEESCSGGGDHVSEMVFVNQIMRSMYDLTQLSKPHENARKILYRLVDIAKDEISNLVQNLSVDDETTCDDITSNGYMDKLCVRNPLTAKAKGVTNANITRHWDTKRNKRKEKKREKLKFQAQKEPKRRGKVHKMPSTYRK